MASLVASLGAIPFSSMQREAFSTTTMASSTTMPMASTSPNRVRVLMENPNPLSTAKVPTRDTGMGDGGNQGGPPVLKEDKDHQKYQQHGLYQRLKDFLDGFLHKERGVVTDPVLESLRKSFLDSSLHVGVHLFGHLEGIGARQLKNADTGGLAAVEVGKPAVVLRTLIPRGPHP